MKKIGYIVIFLAVLILFVGCKSKEEVPPEDVVAEEEYAISEEDFDCDVDEDVKEQFITDDYILTRDADGNITVTDKDGNIVGTKNKDGNIVITDKDGNVVAIRNKDGEYTIKDSDGNIIAKRDKDGTEMRKTKDGDMIITKKEDGTIIGTDIAGNVRFRKYADGSVVIKDKHGRTVAIDKDGTILERKTRFAETAVPEKSAPAATPQKSKSTRDFDGTIIYSSADIHKDNVAHPSTWKATKQAFVDTKDQIVDAIKN